MWQFISRLNQEGHTILLTTHYLEEAEALCGRIAMLKQGRLVALDTTENLLAKHRPAGLPPKLLGDDGAADLEAVFVKIMAESN